MQREVHLFGLPVIHVKKTRLHEKRYFFGVQYMVKKYIDRYDSFTEAFAELVRSVHGRKIRVISNNMGETLVYARTAQFWYNPDELLFGNRHQHVEIFRMYAPHLPVFGCGEDALLPKTRKILTDSAGNSFEAIMHDEEIIRMNNQGRPFLEAWADFLHADFSSLSFTPAFIPPDVEQSALTKAKALHLSLNNFVFLLPAARSSQALPTPFWDDVEHSLRAMGLDVFINSKILSIAEAYVLAKHAKAIIALRSGLCDVLSEIPVPQFVIYSHNEWHGDLQPMYSLHLFPWAQTNLIREYSVLHRDIASIQRDILSHIEHIR